jgi:hypothetical protein
MKLIYTNNIPINYIYYNNYKISIEFLIWYINFIKRLNNNN